MVFLSFIQNNPEVRDRIDLEAVNRHEKAHRLEQFANGPSNLVELMQDYQDVMSRL